MNIKLNYVYRNQDGECFQATEKDGQLVLSNPSYPFVFLPEVQAPLEEVGTFEEFGHLITKENYEFHEGDSLNVKVTDKGLEVQNGK